MCALYTLRLFFYFVPTTVTAVAALTHQNHRELTLTTPTRVRLRTQKTQTNKHKHNKAADLTTLAVCRLRDALHVENLPGEVVDAGKHDDGDAFTLFLYDATDLVHAERLLALRGVGVLV